MNKCTAIGLMSGSSLDGLDIACCSFTRQDSTWHYEIMAADVVAYPDEWIQELKSLPVATAKTFWEAHAALGLFFGEQVNLFISRNKLAGKIDVVASHGHTIFHFPEKRFTTQIGDGSAIAARTNLPVASDFRSADVAYGGQGTPIVPIGDLLLFTGYRFCLNLGGIANISCKLNSVERPVIAFDICAANQVLNSLANRLGKDYDAVGAFSAKGEVDGEVLKALDELEYYGLSYPKSLDNSYSREVILPFLEEFEMSIEDKLRTYVEHIAQQVTNHIRLIGQREKITFGSQDKILATGGGAFNKFLIERLKIATCLTIEVPSNELVKFKEAVVIAFMGTLRMNNEINVLKSVTGAAKDSVGGAVYRP